MITDQWLTVQDVANLLHVRVDAVRRLIRRGELPVLELGGSRTVYRVRRSDLERYRLDRSPTQRLSVNVSPSDDRALARDEPQDDEAVEGSSPGATSAESLLPGSGVERVDDARAFIDHIPAVTFREDGRHRGRLVYMSQEIEHLLGASPEEFSGVPGGWLEWVHPLDREAVERELSRTDETGGPFNMQYRMVRRGGGVVWIRVEAELVSDDTGGASWEGTITDITEYKTIESVLRLRQRQQRAIADFGLLALAGSSLSELTDRAVEIVSRTLDVEHANVFELSPGSGELVLRAGVTSEVGSMEGVQVHTRLEDSAGASVRGDALSAYALKAREAVVSGDLRSEARFDGQGIVDSQGVLSGACVTIPGQPKPFGVLVVFSVQPRTFSPEDTNFLQSIAHILASAATQTDGNWLTVTDVAELLQVTEETVRRWIRNMELPALNLGGPRAGYRVYPSDLERFIRDRLIRMR